MGISMILLKETLPNYWGNFDMFLYHCAFYAPAIAITIFNMRDHLKLIYYTVHGVSEEFIQVKCIKYLLQDYSSVISASTDPKK